jgi:DNA-binding GntR family transcriptional regulator
MRSSAVDAVAAALREAILDGTLAQGAPLREEALAAEHGAARHTVRAALRALAAERLVTIEPHRGARVTALQADDIVALYALRTALEVEAAHLALARHDGRLPVAVHDAAEHLAALCAAKRPRWPVVSAAHSALHEAIVRAARYRRIEEAHATLGQETRLFLLHIRPHYTYAKLAEEHLELVAGLESNGPAVLRAHLRASAALVGDGHYPP